jgi:exodeoxyribonuclease V gamma subunit
MLHIFKSNRLDSLLAALCDVLDLETHRPFDFELITAPDGLHQKVKRTLADRNHIFAGKIVTPRNGIVQLVDRVMGVDERRRPLHPDALQLFVARTILSQLHTPQFESISSYLGATVSVKKLLSLSGVLTGLFGEYGIYRPELMNEWKQFPKDWQSTLYSEASKAFEAHIGEGILATINALGSDTAAAKRLPSRILFFGVSTLPPVFLQLLGAASVHSEVYLFVVTPSMDYFEAGRRSGDETPQNELLTLLGKQPAAFRDALLGIANQVPTLERDLFASTTTGSMLSALQQSIIRNQPPARCAETGGTPSVVFHQCTSVAREVDVVVSSVLRCIMEDGVTPEEIVVMAPDMNDYAPYVEAAMAGSGVPCTISDRTMPAVPGAPEVLASLLALLDSRLGLQDVFSLLQMEPVRKQFSLDGDDVVRLFEACRKARICACIDDDHRRRLGLEPFFDNTWQFGLQRLVLGMAMDSDVPFEGVSPVSAYAVSETLPAGQLMAFLDILFELARLCEGQMTTGEWCALLDRYLVMLVSDTDDSLPAVRATLQQLSGQAEVAGFDIGMDFTAVRILLKNRVTRPSFSSGSGGVRFASFRNLRGESFKVVALLGMDEKKFPAESRTASFDVMAEHPMPGDREARNDGYHMFLEAVMAATRQLLVFYGGAASTGGGAPKVCMPALTLKKAILGMRGDHSPDPDGYPPVVEHPPYSHDPVYFLDSAAPFVNYRRTDFMAALEVRSIAAEGERAREIVPSVPAHIDASADRPDFTLTLFDFFSFWKNPPGYFLTQCLGMADVAPGELITDHEPLQLNGLDEWTVGQLCMDALIDGAAGWDAVFQRVRALGIAPSGNLGVFHARRVFDRAARIADEVLKLRSVAGSSELDVDVCIATPVGGLRLKGGIPIYNDELLEYSYSAVNDSFMLRFLLKYLCVRQVSDSDMPLGAKWVGRYGDDAVQYGIHLEKDEADALLHKVAQHTIRGLQRPLFFIPGEGFAYWKKYQKTAPDKKEALLEGTVAAMIQQLQLQAPAESRVLVHTAAREDQQREFHQVTHDVVGPVSLSVKKGDVR